MQRLIAGAGLLLLALTACGNRVPDGPVPHIVAVGVPTTVTAPPPQPPATPPVAEQKLAVGRASRGQRIRLAAATVPITGDVWSRLARCESGGNPQAVGGRGKFFGAFQFSLRTWHSLGLSGNPIDYSYADQLAAAQRLQARSGWRNWPVCARRVLRA
jgi:hypothetical protein